jgi:hypothetical protein
MKTDATKISTVVIARKFVHYEVRRITRDDFDTLYPDHSEAHRDALWQTAVDEGNIGGRTAWIELDDVEEGDDESISLDEDEEFHDALNEALGEGWEDDVEEPEPPKEKDE